MKKLCPFLLIPLFITLILTFPNSAEAVWEEYVNNPLTSTDNLNNWDSIGKELPHVIFDENIYKMWYTGYDGSVTRIGYATSSSGISWKFYSDYVLGPESANEINYSDSFVIHDENDYKMWLTVLYSQGYKISVTSSDDGIKWETPVPITINHEWESNYNMVQPSVIKKQDGTYLMWYSAVQNDRWKIGFATSTDGLNWEKHPTPVLEATEQWEGNHTAGAKVIFNNGIYEIYYHSGGPPVVNYATSYNGIDWIKPDDNPLIETEANSFKSNQVLSPSVVVSSDNSLKYMWYTGFNGYVYSIGYASSGVIPNINLNPIILIPGMFASWNSKAILEEEQVSQEAWTMTPFVNDYDGIIKTLEKAGYSASPSDPNQNLFVFNYDWRNRAEDTAKQLDQFIKQKVLPKNSGKKIYLVGHSLGGLIGRTYLQNEGSTQVQQLITLGTPHSGAVQSYKAWEGGIAESSNPWERLAFEIILGVNRKGFRTNKDVIREIVPVTHDLLPTFTFLKNSKNQDIPPISMKQQNTWLAGLDTNFKNFNDKFSAIYGETGQTPEWYKTTKPNTIEKLLGLWQDGKPTDTLTSPFGDETVLSKSATRSGDLAFLINGVNHRNLVSDKESISQLTNLLGLTVAPEAIITPPLSQPIFPALFLAIKSPAKFKVSGPNISPTESNSEGIVFIPNLNTKGNYQIEITGINSGIYHLLIGELSQGSSSWKEITRETSAGQIDTYQIIYDGQNPPDDPLIDQNGKLHFNNAYQIISQLKNKYPQLNLILALRSLDNAQKLFERKDYKAVSLSFKSAINYLELFRQRQTTIEAQNLAYSAMEDLIFSYDKMFTGTTFKFDKNTLSKEIIGLTTLKDLILMRLTLRGNEKEAQSYNLAEQLLNKAKADFNKGNYYKTEIELYVTRLLFLEI